MDGIKSRRGLLVLVPLPFQGHLTPMLHLGTVLHSKGFSITVYNPFNYPNSSNYPDFAFLPKQDGLSNYKASGNFLYGIMSLNTNYRTNLQESLVQMMKLQENQNEIVWIIYDSLMHYAEAVAKHLKLPSIILRTTCANNMLCYHSHPRLQEEGHIPIQEFKLMKVVPGIHPIRYIDLPYHNFHNVEGSVQFISQICDIRSSSAVIWNTMDWLEQSALTQLQQLYQVPIFSIGPLHKVAEASSGNLIKEDTSCIKWLDNQPNNSVLYVSFGSMAKVSEKELTEMAWGLANSKQPFMWVIRPGSVVGSEWIELLPPGFWDMVGEISYIVKWAPQREVLEHNAVGGFWSHCGWNSTIESITEGVPLICGPSSGDQRVSARYLSQVWKIGLPLKNDLERGEIERAIRKLMQDDEGKVMRQRALDFKKKIEISIREGGSSHNSLCELVKFIM